uniref:Uncharacterized protein n=1 Tax=viral metagenome TaxID=1070528 RepID=A0A6C0BEV3_9ZZZZ
MEIHQIEFPSVGKILNFSKQYDPTITISDLIVKLLSKNSLLPEISLSSDFYNVLISNKTFTDFINNDKNGKILTHQVALREKLDLKNFIESSNVNNKKIKFYLYEPPGIYPCLKKLPSIFEFIQINGNFDLNIMSFIEYRSIGSFDDMLSFFRNNIFVIFLNNNYSRIYNKSNYSEIKTHLYNFSLNDTEPLNSNREITNCDIKVTDIVPYSKLYINKDFMISLKPLLEKYIESSLSFFDLRTNKFNILVMCANSETIKSLKYQDILKEVLGSDTFINDEDVYYVGVDISVTSKHFIKRGYVNNIIFNNNTRFDLVISENCGSGVIYKNPEEISRLLKDNGVVISPFYKIDNSEKFMNQFTLITPKNCNYGAYIKII